MSSRELLVLIEEFPETSRLKTDRDRTVRLLRRRDGQLAVLTNHGKVPTGVQVQDDGTEIDWTDAEVVAEGIVDWTDEQKILARVAREVATARYDGRDGAQPDLTGLVEPLQRAAQRMQATAEVIDTQKVDAARETMLARLYANVERR